MDLEMKAGDQVTVMDGGGNRLSGTLVRRDSQLVVAAFGTHISIFRETTRAGVRRVSLMGGLKLVECLPTMF